MVGIDYDDLLIAAGVFSGISVNGDEYVRCGACGYAGCDLRIVGCGCTLHARCAHIPFPGPMTACPQCYRAAREVTLLPMSFREIDEARKTALAIANGSRGRKRKSSMDSGDELERRAIEPDKHAEDRRTGRWTSEEMNYVDAVIAKFEAGQLPLVDGMKLNDFLSNMLKSKQSRLTKKMKNAKLSSKAFKRTTGYIVDPNEAREFSDLEDAFYFSIQDQQERAEIKFHMQKEWRELFSNYCVTIGQPVDADQWLSSVEEMDRRVAMAKEAARMAKRRLMIGKALRQDSQNPDRGVFIDKSGVEAPSNTIQGVASETEEFLEALSEKAVYDDILLSNKINEGGGKRQKTMNVPHTSSPFLSKVLSYIIRYNVPFEHVDLWVPSLVPVKDEFDQSKNENACRLCHAGCATTETKILNKCDPPEKMSPKEYFNLTAFGEYSQKFSFDIGCGLPGRVYQTGVPSWEQSVQNAPLHHFERCGGALEWGIKTVLGIPIASPTVERIVIILYSRHDREKNQELVGRLCEEFTKLLPTPTWKLVVDIGHPQTPANVAEPEPAVDDALQAAQPITNTLQPQVEQSPGKDSRIDEVIALLGEHMPTDSTSPFVSYLPGFLSLRLMLLKYGSWSDQESELIRVMLGSYTSYSTSGRTRKDLAFFLARDFMFLMKTQSQMSTSSRVGSAGNSAQSSPCFNGMQVGGNCNNLSNCITNVSHNSPVVRDNCSIVSN